MYIFIDYTYIHISYTYICINVSTNRQPGHGSTDWTCLDICASHIMIKSRGGYSGP